MRLIQRQQKIISVISLVVLAYNFIIGPHLAFAYTLPLNSGTGQYLANREVLNQESKLLIWESGYDLLTKRILYPELEPIKQLIVKDKRSRQVTAYNVGDIYQCDASPCTSANGENICLALENGYKRCAANFVPFGTILEIEGYGQCLVTDRMNSRYTSRVDIAMPVSEKQKAREFGLKHLEVKILAQI